METEEIASFFDRADQKMGEAQSELRSVPFDADSWVRWLAEDQLQTLGETRERTRDTASRIRQAGERTAT